ncbi:hypothetical protein B0H16DRAFT_204164 [Mycena metata]|uniref:Uncharacterized protein n=1 Tax=Mycena metata TaxID=1033252 RepID=A0AAD7I020_9AGAR|nr:hypothetical protein B0H16DRAFT_204164 [Mycena metata]
MYLHDLDKKMTCYPHSHAQVILPPFSFFMQQRALASNFLFVNSEDQKHVHLSTSSYLHPSSLPAAYVRHLSSRLPTSTGPPDFHLLPMVFCAQCGTPGEGRFCTECGARLADSGAAITSTTRAASPPQYGDSAGGSLGGYVPMSAATPAAQHGRAAFSGGMSAGTTSVGGTTSPGGTSAGGVTGVGATPPPTRSNVRGISGSPIVPATTGGSSIVASATSAGFVNSPVVHAPPQESPTALFGSQGYRLDAFFHIAREIFVALDQSTQPFGTQMMEASKIRRFRELGGKSIPPYYETHVLPMYCGCHLLALRATNIEFICRRPDNRRAVRRLQRTVVGGLEHLPRAQDPLFAG